MIPPLKISPTLLTSFLLAAAGPSCFFAQGERSIGIERIRKEFTHPPDDAKIMMRWWWFGSAVTQPELEREMKVMKAAGIGGVEIQPVYPVALDDPANGVLNKPYLSPSFLQDVHFTAKLARQLGMRVDVTLGSGWPYGGPHTPVTEAAGRLRIDRVAVADGQSSAALPDLEAGEKLIAVYLAKGDRQKILAEDAQRLRDFAGGRVQLPSGASKANLLLFFIASRTGQQVKRPAVGAEGFVLDHYNRAAVEHHLAAVAEPLLKSFGDEHPHAVFSDSLEVFGSDWTDDLLPEFQRRRGYDLDSHLLELAADTEQSRSVRHDWGKTLTELAEERYLTPVRNWAHQHNTLFRSQTYGDPPAILSSNDLVDLPEGEAGPHWRGFNTARWASSASHLYGRSITSTETWTWLHSPAYRATPLDMKAEADLHFIEGINQLVGHGWPYSPASAGEPGWRFYAAAAFSEHNPWFQIMPEMTAYLQRVSYLMRQGKPANDIAIYLPTDDAWARFTPGKTSVDRDLETMLGPDLIPQVLNAGYNFDFIDDRAIEKVGIPHRILILPGVERIPLATIARLRDFQQKGGIVVATRRLPMLAPGLKEAETETPRITALSHELFESSRKNAKFVANEETLGSALRALLQPDFAVSSDTAPAIGFIHRKSQDADIYFVVNTSNHPVATEAKVRANGGSTETFDAFTGETRGAGATRNGDSSGLDLSLAPYESRIFVFSGAGMQKPPDPEKNDGKSVEVTGEWKVTFLKTGRTQTMTNLRSWTEDRATQFYSGEAAYEKTINVPNSSKKVTLDFGPGQTVEPSGPPGAPGMRALLESPVRESAIIYVNGTKAGSVWRPPYRVELTQFVRAGENQLRVVVANLAINEIAGNALPSYKLLNSRYGERFVPQGFEHVSALPAGILGPVRLIFQ